MDTTFVALVYRNFVCQYPSVCVLRVNAMRLLSKYDLVRARQYSRRASSQKQVKPNTRKKTKSEPSLLARWSSLCKALSIAEAVRNLPITRFESH